MCCFFFFFFFKLQFSVFSVGFSNEVINMCSIKEFGSVNLKCCEDDITKLNDFIKAVFHLDFDAVK